MLDADLIRAVGDSIGVDWNRINFDEFCAGFEVELEHGTINPSTNITDDDPTMTALIALAHLNEVEDYYTRLAKVEEE